jgi:L-alanine-DL-glutamate epimerase-like enolase superfamily enzyme
MQLGVEPLALHLKTPFRIAHGTSTVRHNVMVRLDGAVGEGALAPYYGISQSEVIEYLESLDPDSLLGEDPLALEDALDRLPPGPAPARAAIDIALHDYWGRQLGQPLYRLWGLNPARAPLSSLTLGIAEDETELRQTLRVAQGFPILKLKLGAGSLEEDEAIVRLAREETGARLCVDANSAWQVDEAVRLIPRLARYDLLFIEQPIPRGDSQAWHRLRQALPGGMPPLIADESVHHPQDVPPLAGAVDGINIKLAKSGGLREARQLIVLARSLGMQVMLGCMVESSVAITAAAHLAPLVDFADLDGNLNVIDDPYAGATMRAGRLVLPSGPGLGVTPRPATAG